MTKLEFTEKYKGWFPYNEREKYIFEMLSDLDAVTKLNNLIKPDVIGQSELLVNFLIVLNDKELINNHDFDYEKQAKLYLKKLNNSL